MIRPKQRQALALLLLLAAVAAGWGASAQAGSSPATGRIGPKSRIQPSGRLLHPFGKTTRIGNFPAGAALTPNGRFVWTLSAGRGINDIRIVQVAPVGRCRAGRRGRACRARRQKRVGRITQIVRMPGLSGGIAMAPDGRTAYVSGVADSSHKDQQAPSGALGKQGDVIHVFSYNQRTGLAKEEGLIGVPPPSGSPTVQDFPPTNVGETRSWPRDLAISPDGKTLLAALNLADSAAVIDTTSKRVRYVGVDHYPYGAAITRNGKYGLVSNETNGTVSVINLAGATRVKTIQVGPHLSHPEGIAIDPVRPRAYVAIANQDAVSVIDTETMSVERTLSVGEPQGIGTSPVSVSVSARGTRLLVSDAGEDAIAVFGLTGPRALQLIGRIPVASYPIFGAGTPDGKRLVWVAGKGLGVGPNVNGPNPDSPSDSDDAINKYGYLPSILRGMSGVSKFPSARQIARLTPIAMGDILPSNREQPPEGTPIAPPGASQKLKYVFYIVRENRTYDQVLGDDPRGDGDPNLTLFGNDITPNMHALVKRFPLLDHVYANSEASIDGHFWTSASAVSDYVVKNWMQNYGGRGRPYDFGAYVVTKPPNGYLFDQAERQGVPYFNFGEALAGVSPLPDKDRTSAETAATVTRLQNSDVGIPYQPPTIGSVGLVGQCFPSDISIGTDSILAAAGQDVDTFDSATPSGAPVPSESRFDCFQATMSRLLLLEGHPRTFNYISLPNNHTQGLSPGRRTPKAMIADNDYGLGQMVDLITHSSYWPQSLILVVEDDSQDGADHVDAHRIPALVISPYAKKAAVIHTRYDFPSFARTLEIVSGMSPLNLFDATGVPLYDAFDPEPHNSEPFTAIPPKVNLLSRNADTAANRRAVRGLNLTLPDRVPQRVLDRMLWQFVHGRNAKAPPPGPNASGKDDAETDEGG